MAGLVSRLVGYAFLTRALRYLDDYTFTGQPIVTEKEAREAP